MSKPHPKNERIKRAYLQWLATAKGAAEATQNQAAAAIDLFAAAVGQKDFAKFHREWALKFTRDLSRSVSTRSGKPIAKATLRARLRAVKGFCKWLADQPGYKSRITHADCEYFNLSANDERIATAARERPSPSLEQIRHVVSTIEQKSQIGMRDRALIAFTLLTGMRDAAIASLPLGNVDLEHRYVDQDARAVRTKNAKTMRTYFFPVGEELEAAVAGYIRLLKTELLFGPTDPLFPATEVRHDESHAFKSKGLSRRFWTSAAPIRTIFRDRFEAANLSYFNPHSFRKTLMRIAYELNLGPEPLKVWSQNLGHENLFTSLNSYGKVSAMRSAEVMARLARPATSSPASQPPPEALEWFTQLVEQQAGNRLGGTSDSG